MNSANQKPIQLQPQNGVTTEQFSKPKAVVSPGLECLVEVEEVMLQNKVFQTRSGQTLFNVRHESECCGPSFSYRLCDPYNRDAVSLIQESSGCCGGETRLIVSSPSSGAIGFITSVTSSGQLSISIQMGKTLQKFFTDMSLVNGDSSIKIINEEGYPVASIIKENEGAVFSFPMDMEATLKALILGAFLYMSFRLQEYIRSQNYSPSDDGWETTGGLDFTDVHHHHGWETTGGLDFTDVHHHHHHHDHIDYHHDHHHDHHDGGDCGGGWDGDCGGGDCGGGDCGGD